MGRYRKKPVVIDAVRIDPEAAFPFAAAMELTKELGEDRTIYVRDGVPVGLDIHTREGTMRADLGDWIIRGVEGEFYPCKPGIFVQTYEPAE